MKNIKLLSLVVALVLSGCATIMKGQTQAITINSAPVGADVYIDGAFVGKTPVNIKLQKGKKDTIMIKKDGYKTVSRDLTKTFDPVAIINIFWDLSTTDVLTGAIYEYDPNSFMVEMQKE